MPRSFTTLRRFRALIALAVVATLTLICARVFVSPEHFDWPAWVQAVGSIAAILVAVWVSADQAAQQQRRHLARERTEVAGMLRSLKSEVSVIADYIALEITAPMQTADEGEPFRDRFPLPENPFQIFDTLIAKVGLIPNEKLHYYLIHTYALAKRFLMAVSHHNNLLNDLNEAEMHHREVESVQSRMRVEICEGRLAEYSDWLHRNSVSIRTELSALSDALSIAYQGT